MHMLHTVSNHPARTWRALLFALALLMLLAAAPPSFALKILVDGGGPDRELIDKLEDAKDELPVNPGSGTSSSSSTVTLRGSVFYNDQRIDGLFSTRNDMATGKPGAQCDPVAKRPDCTDSLQRLIDLRAQRDAKKETLELLSGHQGAGYLIVQEQLATLESQVAAEQAKLAVCQANCGPNWLAGKYMVVDAYELDSGFLPTDVNCHKEERLTSATVGRDGTFKLSFAIPDACARDKLGKAIKLRVRLGFCNSNYCFSINESKNDVYEVIHPNASTTKPLKVKGGDDITLSTLTFNTSADPMQPNNHSIAANYYASIVDTVLSLHKDNKIPFYAEEMGELEYIFPSKASETATALSPNEVVISSYQSQPDGPSGRFEWVSGQVPAHEYGHVLMQRAWDGKYGFRGVGITAEDSVKAVSAQIAFKEGWAEFIARAVFDDSRGCGQSFYDKNGEITLDCSAISKRLAGLRKDRKEQADLLPALLGHPGYDFAKEKLDQLDAQIAADEKSLAECRKRPTAVDYSNSVTSPDTYTSHNLKGPLGEGAQWRDNVTKALCDWYDTTNDDDLNLAGPGDRFAEPDIYAMWFNLRRMYVDAAQYGGQYKSPGLWFCDWVDYYLDVRKSAAAVGPTVHADQENRVRDLIYNNNIGCSRPAPL